MAGPGGPYGGGFGPGKPGGDEWRRQMEAANKAEQEAAAKKKKQAEELTSTLGRLARTLTDTAGTATVLGIAANTLQRTLGAISSQIAQFVEAWNPAAVNRFRFAVTDLNAAIGRALAPVLEKLTATVRTLGDTLASLSPAGQKLIAALGVAAVSMTVMAGGAVLFSLAVNSATGGLVALTAALAGAAGGMAYVMQPVNELKAALRQLGDALSGVLNVLGSLVQAVARAVGPAIGGMVALVSRLVTALANAAAGVMPRFEAMWGRIGAVVEKVAAAFAAQLPLIEKAAAGFFAVGLKVAEAVVSLYEAAAPALAALAPLVPAFVQMLSGFQRLTAGVFSVVVSLVKAFMPFVEIAAKVAGAVGGLVGALVELGGTLAYALGSAVGAFVESAGKLLSALMPLITGALDAAVAIIHRIADGIRRLTDVLSALLGLVVESGVASTHKPGASDGLGVRNARIGSLEEMSRTALVSAFSLGMDKKQDPQIQIVNETKRAADILDTVKGILDEIKPPLLTFLTRAGQASDVVSKGRAVSDGMMGGAVGWAAERLLSHAVGGKP